MPVLASPASLAGANPMQDVLESQLRSNDLNGFLGAVHRNKLKVNEILPVGRPLLQEQDIIAFHQLEAAIEVCLDPALHIGKTFRCRSSLIAERRYTALASRFLERSITMNNMLVFLSRSEPGGSEVSTGAPGRN